MLLGAVVCVTAFPKDVLLKSSPIILWGGHPPYLLPFGVPDPCRFYYTNPQEPFQCGNAVAPQYYDFDLTVPDYRYSVVTSGLQIVPGAIIINGVDVDYGWTSDLYYYQNNILTAHPQPLGGGISPITSCANGWSFKITSISSFNNNVWCEKTISTYDPQPESCGDGNPIYPESGLKQQTVIDFKSPNGLLDFVRNYRNDTGIFTSQASPTIGFVDYSSAQKLSTCVAVDYTNTSTPPSGASTVQSTCTPLYNSGERKALLVTTKGALIEFSHDGLTGTAQAGSSVQAFKSSDGNYWLVRSETNFVEQYDLTGRLVQTTSVSGAGSTYTYSDASTPTAVAPFPGLLTQQTDSFGRSTTFTYNAAGLLSQFTDPDGNVYIYRYDSRNRLVSVAYPVGANAIYSWNEPAYTSGVDNPKALTGISETWMDAGQSVSTTVRTGTYAYDTSGMALSTEGAGGLNKFTVSQRNSSQVVVTDPLGSLRTRNIGFIANAWRATSTNQPAGSGCAAAGQSMSYDGNGNMIRRDDFNGMRACYAFDISRRLRTTAVEGLSNTVDCTTVNPVASTLPTGSRKTGTEWHPDWSIKTREVVPRKITTWVYNGQPDPFNGNAVASCAPSTATLPDGKPIVVLCKKVEQATTDANGASAFSAALQAGVPNRVWQWTYNQHGQVLTEKDPLGNTSTWSYYADTTADHTVGDLSQVTNALSQVTQYIQYNKAGQLLQSQDPNGVLTVNTYDPRQRLTSQSVGGQTTTYTWDPTGLLKQVTQPDGAVLNYGYDAAHRLTSVSDGVGNTITYTLDNAGNRTKEEVKDANGVLARSVNRVFDALNRLQAAAEGMQ
jgi:YD repeat-containing protein